MCHGSNCRRHVETLAARPEPVAKRTHEDEGREDVQAESCQEGDNDVPEDGVRKQIRRSERAIRFFDVFNALEREEERSDLIQRAYRFRSQES